MTQNPSNQTQCPESLSIAARAALLGYMEYWSEERWCAGWLIDLEYALVRLGDDYDSGALPWLVDQAGGWWTWSDEKPYRRFVEGTYVELQMQAAAKGWKASDATAAPDPAGIAIPKRSPGDGAGEGSETDPSWEAVARRLWGARYKLGQFLAIVVGLDALSLWLNWSENTTLLVGVPVAVLVLLPDPPLWRMPLRSPKASGHDSSASNV